MISDRKSAPRRWSRQLRRRFAYPEHLMVKDTIDEQGVYVRTWVLNAFKTLLKSQPPD